MKVIAGYIRLYFYETNPLTLCLVTLFAGLFIWVNYHFRLDASIAEAGDFQYSFFSRWGIFMLAFSIPYLVNRLVRPAEPKPGPGFYLLLVLAPAIFSLKVALPIQYQFSGNWVWQNYWNHIIYWPSLVVITGTMLWILWKLFDRQQPFYGLTARTLNWNPYWLMLLIMVPLVAAASTQPDFLAMYPKLKLINPGIGLGFFSLWHKLLFELAYGCDFITIELFFRGFLVLAFVKWAGKDAILPMACFYCTIHFGKPIGECISSYFGGMILGVVVYHTRSIFGGLMVHVGIAWLMEGGGYLGNMWSQSQG